MAAKGGRAGNRKSAIVIIRREDAPEPPHHSGAWKVAYADFVTAMMAFFLLMWLLNATTMKQRQGLADYFSPANLFSRGRSGAGKPFGGHTPFDHGALVSDRGVQHIITGPNPPDPHARAQNEDLPGQRDRYMRGGPYAMPSSRPSPLAGPGGTPMPAQMASTAAPSSGATPSAAGPAAGMARAQREAGRFRQAAARIRKAIRADPALRRLAPQLAVDQTRRGLRIQLLDARHKPMFAFGSAAPNARARQLLRLIGPILAKLPERIAIGGYTDAAPYPGPLVTNWELSADRANATRRMLLAAGVPGSRIDRVTGHADRDLLVPSNPLAPANRRIAITILRTAAPAPPIRPTPR